MNTGPLAVAGVLLAAAACDDGRSPPSANSSDASSRGADASPPGDFSQFGFDFRAPGQGYVPFTITRVYENQEPADAPPWHATGGRWLFFDATLDGAPAIPFTVGLRVPWEKNTDVPESEATISVPDAETGARFVERFANGIHTPNPPSRWKSPLYPQEPFGASVPDYTHWRNYAWTVSRWFLYDQGYLAIVFFDFNLASRVGEFREFDEKFRPRVVRALIARIRDGLPNQR